MQHDIDAMEGVKTGKIQLLFISPESLLSNESAVEGNAHLTCLPAKFSCIGSR